MTPSRSRPPTLDSPLLSRSTVDRAALDRARPELLAEALAEPSTRVLEVRDLRLPVTTTADGGLALRLRPPSADDVALLHDDDPEAPLVAYLGRDDHGAHVAVLRREVPPEPTPPAEEALTRPASGAPGGAGPDRDGGGWLGLREAALRLDSTHTGLATSAIALGEWHSRHAFCARCGSPSRPVHGGWVRRCTAGTCGADHYPRTDPAVIMAVTDDADRLLLARGPSWPPDRLSVLAGFVEPGESLEAAVCREVREEVGLEVTDVRYLGNQPWPFPCSLMLAFSARVVPGSSTAPHCDPVEIAEAHWFTRGGLREAVAQGTVAMSGRLSIARGLIEHWLGGPLDPPTA